MSIKCLMIETSDKKRLFTTLGVRKKLEKCCGAFGAKMHAVRAELKRSQLMPLPRIVSALCESSSKSDRTDFKIIENSKKVKGQNDRSR